MVKKIKRVYHFITRSKNKIMLLKVLCISAFYRMCILLIPKQILQKFMGKSNEESTEEESLEAYEHIRKVAYVVNKVCDITPWESKCLVRALSAQHLLHKEHIESTLYLGVGKVDEKMVAHAWIRSGRYFLTGGNGSDYAQVAKFRK